MFNKKKKTVLVTGASSSGMRKEIAKRLIEDGFRVYAAARHVEKVDALAKLGAKPLRIDTSKKLSIPFLKEVDGVDLRNDRRWPNP